MSGKAAYFCNRTRIVYFKVHSWRAQHARMKCNERCKDGDPPFLLHASAERANNLSPFLLISFVSFGAVFSVAVKRLFLLSQLSGAFKVFSRCGVSCSVNNEVNMGIKITTTIILRKYLRSDNRIRVSQVFI